MSSFKDFVLRDQLVSYIIGVSVGASYALVVNALVNSIIMPVVSHYLLNDQSSLSSKKYILRPKECDAQNNVQQDEIAIIYGNLIQALLNLAVVASSVYVMIRVIGHITKRDFLQVATTPSRTEQLLEKILVAVDRNSKV